MKGMEKPDKLHLQKVISNLRDGKFAIPTFQREFDWNPKDIIELIKSIFEDYYIGTLLFWRISSENISSLKHEPSYGFKGNFSPNYYVLDVQQRLSAIYYSFCSPDINFRNKKSKCYFFINLSKFLEEKYEEAFFYLWESKKLHSLLENKTEQFENHIFPLKILGDNATYLWTRWIDEYRDYWLEKGSNEYKNIREELFNIFEELLQDYEISFVELDKNLDMSKVCDIFTRLNSRGVDLSIFDILNAAFLPKGIELKEKWREIQSTSIKAMEEDKMKVYLLQIISIFKQGYCSPKYLYFLVPGAKRKIRVGKQLAEDVLIASKEEFIKL